MLGAAEASGIVLRRSTILQDHRSTLSVTRHLCEIPYFEGDWFSQWAEKQIAVGNCSGEKLKNNPIFSPVRRNRLIGQPILCVLPMCNTVLLKRSQYIHTVDTLQYKLLVVVMVLLLSGKR